MKLHDDDKVAVTGMSARTLLTPGKQRRAIVDYIIGRGGRARVDHITAAFRFDCRPVISSLVQRGWLDVLPKVVATKRDEAKK